MTLVWAHGGSGQSGSAAAAHPVTYRSAALSGWRVVSVDYRLAPRHRHPAALTDVVTALDWSRGEAGTPPSPLEAAGRPGEQHAMTPTPATVPAESGHMPVREPVPERRARWWARRTVSL